MSEINGSGLKPLGVAVLVEEFKPERKIGKIVIPESATGRQSMIDNRVKVVAIGPTAWADEGVWVSYFFGLLRKWRQVPRAKVGDVVLVTQFAGFMASGADGKTYRYVNDRDLFAGMDEQAFEAKAYADIVGAREAA